MAADESSGKKKTDRNAQCDVSNWAGWERTSEPNHSGRDAGSRGHTLGACVVEGEGIGINTGAETNAGCHR